MRTVAVKVTVSGSTRELDIGEIRRAQTSVKQLVAGGESVLVLIESSNIGKEHLEQARRYSSDVRDIKKEIRRANAMLVIAALRSAKIPTHSQPFENPGRARSFLAKMRAPTAAVV
jgi:hypothetical protein